MNTLRTRLRWQDAILAGWISVSSSGLSGCSSKAIDPPSPPAARDPDPPLRDEGGFIEIESIDATIRGRPYPQPNARNWYVFQAADDSPETKPLAVLFNGGPGAPTSSGLFAFGTGRRTADPELEHPNVVVANPATFTRFANLLYVDQRQTGFSYETWPPGPVAPPRDAVSRPFDVFADAADFVRVVLRFVHAHPALERAPIILVGESYGGMRASAMLNLLLGSGTVHPEVARYVDPALVREIREHH